MNDRSKLLTELRNPDSTHLDALSVADAVELLHRQDLVAVEAVGKEKASIARARPEIAAGQLRQGGRLRFISAAGTSGPVSACSTPSNARPTFRADPETVQGVIAGGMEAMFKAKEGCAEDSQDGMAPKDVDDKGRVNSKDVVMGIAAGGTTPYVHGASAAQKKLGRENNFPPPAYNLCPTNHRSTLSSAHLPARKSSPVRPA